MSRICVPDFQWTTVLLSNLGGVPSVCQMSWWTNRSKFKEDGPSIVYRLLRKIKQQGIRATHVLDRGYARYKMLEWLFLFEQDFIIHWKKNHLLVHHIKGQKKTHLLARSFKAIEQLINKLPFNSVEQALEYINELEKEKKQQSIFKPQNPI